MRFCLRGREINVDAHQTIRWLKDVNGASISIMIYIIVALIWQSRRTLRMRLLLINKYSEN